MRTWQKILFPALAILLVLFISLHIFVNIQGKSILIKKLEQIFHRKVRIADLSTTFPNNIRLKDLEAEGLFKIKEVYAAGIGFNIFSNTFTLSSLKIIQPVVTIERDFAHTASKAFVSAPPQVSAPAASPTPAANSGPNQVTMGPNGFLPANLSVNRIAVSDGTINFIDKLQDNKDILIKVEQLNFAINNLNPHLLGSQKTTFNLKGKIPWREGQEQGKIEAGGWVDFIKRGIEADFDIKDIDGVYLYPYYSNWVDLEKARIESAKLKFSSKITGVDNNITADCHLELTDIVRKPLPPEQNEQKAAKITDAVLDMFKAMDQGKIVLDFTIRTKMDRPEFGFAHIKMAFEDKLAKSRKPGADILALPGNVLRRTMKGASDFSRAILDGTSNIAKELRKVMEGTSKQ